MNLYAVHYVDSKTNKKGFNIVEAENNDKATIKSGIFYHKSRFTWTGTEPYK